MPRIVPSQVVEFIDRAFPFASRKNADAPARVVNQQATEIECLVELVGSLPPELSLDISAHISLRQATIRMTQTLQRWASGDSQKLANIDHENPVRIVRSILANCPDELPAATTSGLAFIADADLCQVLRSDITAVNRALSNGEWKAATVLAGSVVEALLLWALQEKGEPAWKAAAAKATPGADKNCLRWDLHDYTAVAAELGIITPATVVQVDIARGFRNLIHPGRAERLKQKCDRATALSAVAAMEHVMRDLYRAAE